ncbi:MAG: carboxymuconolactone decarboxylase family protein [Vicingaceae bacterium]|nr:carboxymuconolactone decarboxylase family protein [Vicingaceae bacterium]
MARIEALTKEQAHADVQPIFDGMKQKLGMVPKIYATLANSPAALKANLTFGDTLKAGSLSMKEVETVALSVSQINNCTYCLAAHTAVGKMAGFTEEETIAIRTGEITDSKIKALSELAKEITTSKGNPAEATLNAFYNAGYSKATLIEVIGLVALNTFNNYFNHIAETPVDFPLAKEVQTA